MTSRVKYDVTEPQSGWKRCPMCKRDGFRPPWQGYCYNCTREYQRARHRKLKTMRTEFEKTEAIKSWHETQKLIAIDQGIDPKTLVLTDPPWLETGGQPSAIEDPNID